MINSFFSFNFPITCLFLFKYAFVIWQSSKSSYRNTLRYRQTTSRRSFADTRPPEDAHGLPHWKEIRTQQVHRAFSIHSIYNNLRVFLSSLNRSLLSEFTVIFPRAVHSMGFLSDKILVPHARSY